MKRAYYNDNDRFVCDWLSNLMDAGQITGGCIDDRSIADIEPSDVEGYERVHLFAGIGGWDLALDLAGWGRRPVWTGSCPCQPFSSAGKRQGEADERHLWPAFHRLIAECRPPVVFGEQVARTLGREWLSAVRLDLEDLGYACGAADICATGIGAPHLRQRLYWVADADGRNSCPKRIQRGGEYGFQPQDGGASGRVGKSDGSRPFARDKAAASNRHRNSAVATGRLGDADQPRPQGRGEHAGEHAGQRAVGTTSPWDDIEWLRCGDGRLRPSQPGICPVAHGVSARVGRVRGYGNAIVPQIAAEFIAAYMETA